MSPNDWEEVKRGGDSAIEKWIATQLAGRSCTVVLVGAETANRKWVRHEIVESWNLKKGVVGIRVHNLKDENGNQDPSGENPFDKITVGKEKEPMSSIVKLYRPTSSVSTEAYAAIKNNISTWIDEAIKFRNSYSSRG